MKDEYWIILSFLLCSLICIIGIIIKTKWEIYGLNKTIKNLRSINNDN